MSMYEAGEIIDTATREIPEAIMDNEQVQSALQYLFDTVAVLTDWIDPDSEGYRESLWEAERDGAYAVAEYYRKSLEEALYRQKMFGTQFDLERFLDGLHGVSVQEVLDASR